MNLHVTPTSDTDRHSRNMLTLMDKYVELRGIFVPLDENQFLPESDFFF